ncbi:MAG: ABC-F family ATP-binding cassette domain-containing protein [Acidobacteria bacterium]|nr:ABC-F family ATP-binding cassette domain-containing protein [Acidobacteriota bacterium]MCB9396990.1 ABC-F family ATP-binding cassette domain-containing protein [Acidobacteriota bacterium]
MISINNLEKRFGARVLFSDVNLRFDPGNRYGLVGANGAGKSTLLRILTGEELYDAGSINIAGNLKIGTMNQDHFAFEQVRISDVVLAGNPRLYGALQEKEELLVHPDPDPHRIAEVEEIIAHEDGYVAESRVAEILEGLGIALEKHALLMSTLSGGYKLRVLLAQCLFGSPEILILDEPTNHLDIHSIRWLEGYLQNLNGTVILVSHDRTFLNRVCTHIADVDYETVKLYKGNYDQFLASREQEEHFRRIENEKAEKKIDDLKNFVDRFKAKASKARQAQSKVKQIERMEKGIVEPKYSSRIAPTIRFSSIRPPGKTVLEVENLQKSYGDHSVLKGVSFQVFRGDKVAIIGPNGIGKSTLLKIITKTIEADGGSYTWGHETYPGYFAQDHHAEISANTTPYEWLYQFGPAESIGTIRGILGTLLFTGDDVHKSTAALSGGESARLILSKLVLLKPNVLILDEPTNHLDMESIEALVSALQAYDGTVLLVSHNRYVVEQVATKVLELKPDGLDYFDGSYHEYLEKLGVDHLAEVGIKVERTKEKSHASRDDRKQNADRRKAYQAEAKPLVTKNEWLEGQIKIKEEAIEEINNLFFDPNYFNKTKPDEVKRKNQEKQTLEKDLESLMEQWSTVQTELEALAAKHKISN